MRWLLAAVLMAGCDLVFPLDDAPLDRPGTDAAPCLDGTFGGAMREVAGFASRDGRELDPAVTASELELWFTAEDGNRQLFVARRAAADQDFGAPEEIVIDVLANQVVDPALTADGQLILFVADSVVRQAERVGDRFGLAETPSGLAVAPSGIDVSGDGLAVYFSAPRQSGGQGIFRSERPVVGKEFGNPEALDVPGRFPSVRFDELELFYTLESGSGIGRRARASVKEAWGAEEVVVSNGVDPEISADGRSLYFAADNTLYVMTRACE